jgi:hypothetical protein
MDYFYIGLADDNRLPGCLARIVNFLTHPPFTHGGCKTIVKTRTFFAGEPAAHRAGDGAAVRRLKLTPVHAQDSGRPSLPVILQVR